MQKTKQAWIVIPTYNEAENIKPLLEHILSLPTPGFELTCLVVDDNSPDKTGEIVSAFSQKNPKVKLLTRTKKRGRGFAGIDGFRLAIEQGADLVVEMDADFSHNPDVIPDLLKNCNSETSVVIGSRFVKGGADVDRGPIRRIITFFAGLYIRKLLDLDVHDPSSGYRCFTRKVLEDIELDNFISTGPSIVQELLFKSVNRGARIKEIPIQFVDRTHGHTKLDWVTLLEVLVMVLRLRELKKKNRLFTLTQTPTEAIN